MSKDAEDDIYTNKMFIYKKIDILYFQNKALSIFLKIKKQVIACFNRKIDGNTVANYKDLAICKILIDVTFKRVLIFIVCDRFPNLQWLNKFDLI